MPEYLGSFPGATCRWSEKVLEYPLHWSRRGQGTFSQKATLALVVSFFYIHANVKVRVIFPMAFPGPRWYCVQGLPGAGRTSSWRVTHIALAMDSSSLLAFLRGRRARLLRGGPSFLPTYLSLQFPSRCSGGGNSIWLSLFQVMRLIFPLDFTFLIKCVWGYSLL